jgi:hypothetical protein
LDEVAAGSTVTARANDKTPEAASSEVKTADSSSAANRLLWRVPVADIDKTVLVKGPASQQHGSEPTPAAH